MISGLTRQETILLTGVSSSRLSYLDSIGLVSPEKFGNPKHPKVIYSWQKIIQIKIIDMLKKQLSLLEIRKVLEFLEQHNYKPSFFQCNLVFINEQLCLIENWQDFGFKVLEASAENKGQLVIHQISAIEKVISELRAKRNEILDFDKRVKGTPLDFVSPI